MIHHFHIHILVSEKSYSNKTHSSCSILNFPNLFDSSTFPSGHMTHYHMMVPGDPLGLFLSANVRSTFQITKVHSTGFLDKPHLHSMFHKDSGQNDLSF